jgi:hypothetical protein
VVFVVNSWLRNQDFSGVRKAQIVTVPGIDHNQFCWLFHFRLFTGYDAPAIALKAPVLGRKIYPTCVCNICIIANLTVSL